MEIWEGIIDPSTMATTLERIQGGPHRIPYRDKRRGG